MPEHDIIVVGASAGGVESLINLVSGLNTDIPSAVFVVLHMSRDRKTSLPSILNRKGSLPVTSGNDGEIFQPGHVYVAPPDYHMMINDSHLELTKGPLVNGVRPSVDVLFRSAAEAFGQRVIGVVLSGMLDDGTAGSYVIKQHGGLVIAQDVNDALFPSMPGSVIENVPVDLVLPSAEIPEALNRLAREPGREGGILVRDTSERDKKIIERSFRAFEDGTDSQNTTILTCPECGGVLWELKEGQLIHYRCHVGHIYSPESLFEAKSQSVENALWSALRALVEKAALCNRLAIRARKYGRKIIEHSYLEQARRAERDAEVLREILTDREHPVPGSDTASQQANQEVTDEITDSKNMKGNPPD